MKAVRAVAAERDVRILDAIDLAGCTGLRREGLATLTWDKVTTTDRTDREIAGIMGWSEAEIERIRSIYVDDRARTVALDCRIARGL